LWAGVLLVVCVRAAVWPRVHSLYLTYATAGADWVAGADLYYRDRPAELRLDQYRYSPLVAVLLTPFHLLPERAGGVLWRLLNGGVFLAGVAWWLRAAAPVTLDGWRRGLFLLLLLPLALASLNNGQPNALMAGLMLAALAAAATDRWPLAAAALTLAAAVKGYPLALALLLAVTYPRRFAPWLLLTLLAAIALPFLFQRPDYVAGQYASWYRVVADDDRKLWPWSIAYRDLWLLLRLWAVPVGRVGYLAIQLGMAAACAAVVLAARRLGWTRKRLLAIVWSLGAGWMMLCGPATESCTYIVLAPALTWAVVASIVPRPAPGRMALPLAAYGLLLLSVAAGLLPRTGTVHAYGMQPLAALLFFAGSLGGAAAHLTRALPPERVGWLGGEVVRWLSQPRAPASAPPNHPTT
jgi:hypothetical protein